MTYRPVIIGSGLTAWRFLKRSLPVQQAQLAASHRVQSNGAYFERRFPELTTADDLVNDRRVLAVVLGAYGLEGDINNKFFIRKILSEGVANDTALANKLSDQRYRQLARDFDFSSSPPAHLVRKDMAQTVVKAYETNLFEVAVGETDVGLRLSLGFGRELAKVAESGATNKAMWYRVLGSPPLRKVFEGALSLPSDFAKLDIDSQLQRVTQKASEKFGSSSISELALSEKADEIVQRFVIQSQISAAAATNRYSTALALLSSVSGRSFT